MGQAHNVQITLNIIVIETEPDCQPSAAACQPVIAAVLPPSRHATAGLQ